MPQPYHPLRTVPQPKYRPAAPRPNTALVKPLHRETNRFGPPEPVPRRIRSAGNIAPPVPGSLALLTNASIDAVPASGTAKARLPTAVGMTDARDQPATPHAPPTLWTGVTRNQRQDLMRREERRSPATSAQLHQPTQATRNAIRPQKPSNTSCTVRIATAVAQTPPKHPAKAHTP